MEMRHNSRQIGDSGIACENYPPGSAQDLSKDHGWRELRNDFSMPGRLGCTTMDGGEEDHRLGSTS